MGSHSKISRHRVALDDEAQEDFYAAHGHTRAPLLVQWMATLRCPLSCAHCLAAGEGPDVADMPLARALGLVDEVARMGVGEFLVTGGEPLVREDMPAVIERLSRRGVSWSLNTAIMPTGAVRRALEEHPPHFVAVSLDGPAEVHDAFRGRLGSQAGSLEAIAFFSRLPGCEVAAGTTVTARNFDHLPHTFHLAAQSGADSWGIHLLVPEGRAARARNLFLSRSQLRRLLRSVARWRKYFPVQLADEIGYCGDWEPQLRDHPFRCGAGVAQCVVLPDGSVVPCTTLDRTAAAGNINDTPLETIWRDGFAPLRAWRATGKCIGCDYAPACGGGCWLQRRHGRHCFRDVWHVRGALKSAAGVAVCLGMLAAHAESAEPATRPARPPAAFGEGSPEIGTETGGGIEQAILAWYSSQLPATDWPDSHYRAAPKVDTELNASLKDDPAGIFLTQFRNGQLPGPLDELAPRIDSALKTRQRSLSFSALVWRAVAENCMRGQPPEKRTEAQRALLRNLLARMGTATNQWRRDIFDKKLDPYLARGRRPLHYRFEMTKARPANPTWLSLARDTAMERWGSGYGKTPEVEALEGYLDRHPYGDQLQLSLDIPAGQGLTRLSADGETQLKGKAAVGVYDVLRTPGGQTAMKIKIAAAADPTRVQIEAVLPSHAELTYADLIVLADRQEEARLDGLVKDMLKRESGRGRWAGFTNPLFLPAVLRVPEQEPKTQSETGKAVPPTPGPSPVDTGLLKRLWLADFWLF